MNGWNVEIRKKFEKGKEILFCNQQKVIFNRLRQDCKYTTLDYSTKEFVAIKFLRFQ